MNIGSGEILQGHVLDILTTLPTDTVDCVVTSPPYWGLRDYKIEPQIWDNDCPHDCEYETVCKDDPQCADYCPKRCEHEWGEESYQRRSNDDGEQNRKQETNKGAVKRDDPIHHAFCLRCGAWRGSLGLEPTPELFVKHIVDIFREVRRVLKPTGVCFVNLGDSYAQSQQGRSRNGTGGQIIRPYGEQKKEDCLLKMPPGLKPKDLCGIPWRVAFALQADGWWLRSDIIWSKPNPMPESVTDRPTKSHEYIFMFTKSARYFWNQEAVREPATYPNGANSPERISSPYGQGFTAKRSDGSTTSGRNIRSVWTFATEPTPEAHFATFPQELVRRCILAGTSERGCCPKCGKPWVPVVSLGKVTSTGGGEGREKSGQCQLGRGDSNIGKFFAHEHELTGWLPSCHCNDYETFVPGEEKTVPAVVLDPFFGSGTTGIVAENLYRKWVGIELNPDYIEIARKRLESKANVNQGNWLKG